MRVLMIEFFYPENTYTQELGEALSKHLNLTIACKKNVPLPQDDIYWKGILYEGGHGKIAAVFLYMKSLLDLCQEIRRGRYDVVNVQYMRKLKYEAPIFRMLRRYYGVLANTVHTILPHEATPADRKSHQAFYDHCDLFIVHNQECKRRLAREYGVKPEKICVMPHGVYSRKEGEAIQTAGRKDGKTHFLFFGQLRKYKGVDTLLRAIALIPPETRIKMHVTIAGPQYPKLDDTDYEGMIPRLGIEDCVTLIKRHIPVEEHAALFAETDVCLFPYTKLYGSGALLMAYTYDKPVLVSDDPIFREETDDGKTGLLFEKENPRSLADAMVSALSWTPEAYARYSAHIRRMKEEKFNWEKSAVILTQAYENALKK